MFDQQAGDAVAVEFADRVEHFVDDRRRQAERGFVEHDELRRTHQAAGDRQHLLLAARQCARWLARTLGKHRKQRQRALAIYRPAGASARQHRADLEIFLYRKRRKYLPAFRDLTDSDIANPMARPAQDILPAKHNPARCRAIHARERADERRFAGAIGADNRDYGALLDIERYAIERLHIAIENIKLFNAQHYTGSVPR